MAALAAMSLLGSALRSAAQQNPADTTASPDTPEAPAAEPPLSPPPPAETAPPPADPPGATPPQPAAVRPELPGEAAAVSSRGRPDPGAPAAATPPPVAQSRQDGFSFGSYGRVVAATDLRGRPGRDADIVAHGSRLDESSYVELTLRRDDRWQKTGASTGVVTTLAVAHPIFHHDGVFDASIALRNLYLEVGDLGAKGLSLWAGSRMYRGDDIYLLDWWPLDNLNTLGGGVQYAVDERTTAALQAGLSRPQGLFFTQSVERPSPFNQMGAVSVEVLSRQKFIGSARAAHVIPLPGRAGLKGVAYGELHTLARGQRQTEPNVPNVYERLPADSGYVLGAEIGATTGERDTHVNLFVRYARGLAAYGELATPVQLAADGTTSGAHELVVALGGNWERGPFGVMVAGYVRSFRDASPDLDLHDVDEGIVMARPHVFFGDLGGLAVEASYQAQQRGVFSTPGAPPGSLDAPGAPHAASLVRFGVSPFVTPAGRGDLSRPVVRLIWALTLRDEGARGLYPEDDVFGLRETEHFFGLGAEWWFNTPS
ncbi:carbohydrate porin [Sorangium sp. So ce406]|uniref:carbohydrate porin n=1 Tax=Sorangium sp. So ce406 TaxID=3133311 RepID=UPI003F5BACD1